MNLLNKNFHLKRFLKLTSLVAILLTLMTCAAVQSVSLTGVPQEREKVVSTEVHDWLFLSIALDNDFADEARVNLQKQCPNGKIMGIYTIYETYFYLLLKKRVVKARGFCVEG